MRDNLKQMGWRHEIKSWIDGDSSRISGLDSVSLSVLITAGLCLVGGIVGLTRLVLVPSWSVAGATVGVVAIGILLILTSGVRLRGIKRKHR
jgi:hypothetical protein